VTACSSYRELVIENKVVLPGEISKYKFTDAAGDKKPGAKPAGQKSLLISSIKYIAKGEGFKPESRIMDMGVEETLKGNYAEAEILFKEIQENITDGSVENNLAVIYELTKRKKDAMKMYTSALIKSPANSKFRSNLLSYINHNKFTQ
jgi:tetratricopeptide (TPR) repeat protein